MRTYIDELKKHVGSEVSVAGWVDARRAHGKLIFIDLRDRTGVIQSVVTPKHEAAYAQAALLRGEWVIEARGIVNKRPEKMVNPDLETGTIELE
ncbi:MAG: OB-fold nucleic acid binding domain-containing protein, partial [Patescibacteria group bacterium]